MPSTEVAVSDLVYIHIDRKKLKARDRYLVVSVEGARRNIHANLLDLSYATHRIGSKELSSTRYPNECRDMTPYPRRSLDAESSGDCDDTHGQAQYQGVGFPEPPHVPVELSTPAQRLDESLNAPVEYASSASGIHQDAECPDEVPEVPRRSQHKPRKPKWFADCETN